MTIDLPIELHYKKFRFDDDEFYDFCIQNDELKFERDTNGNIFAMPNTGGITGKRNFKLAQKVANWNDIYGLGEGFDSSTAFKLPSSSVRSPDVAWISNKRWNSLTQSEQEKFPPICPDFVIELMSFSDSEPETKKKMTEEWMANGCRLAWLINPFEEKAFIYRQGKVVEETNFSTILSGEDILPNFELDLKVLLK